MTYPNLINSLSFLFLFDDFSKTNPRTRLFNHFYQLGITFRLFDYYGILVSQRPLKVVNGLLLSVVLVA
jgi:hypothetical protein